jgi:DNA (cytosine-5)-methyltransferase 1
MGIDWMNRDELSEAIPPAYTEFIGRQLLGQLERASA